jgi:DNA-binding SARP family transcriptional activator
VAGRARRGGERRRARRPRVLASGSSGRGESTTNSTEPRIRLLGGFSVAAGDNVVADRAWRLRKAKALVKILALAPDRRVHRERLAELLWPERDADAAANNLNQALFAARRALDSAGADGAAALASIDGAVVLTAQVDVDDFEAAAARARADREPDPATRALYQQLLAPPAGAAAARDGNLPRQLTSFVGRERERADIARLLGTPGL